MKEFKINIQNREIIILQDDDGIMSGYKKNDTPKKQGT